MTLIVSEKKSQKHVHGVRQVNHGLTWKWAVALSSTTMARSNRIVTAASFYKGFQIHQEVGDLKLLEFEMANESKYVLGLVDTIQRDTPRHAPRDLLPSLESSWKKRGILINGWGKCQKGGYWFFFIHPSIHLLVELLQHSVVWDTN